MVNLQHFVESSSHLVTVRQSPWQDTENMTESKTPCILAYNIKFELGKWPNLRQGRNSDTQLSTAISAPTLLKEPHNHTWAIHRNPVNGLMMIFEFYG